MVDVTFLAQKRLTWKTSLSAEDQGKLEEEQKNWEAEETKAEKMAEFTATFQSADTDADGKLNRAEFDDFMTKLIQNLTARGVPHQPQADYSAEEHDGIYALFDAQGPEPGVTVADFFGIMTQVAAKVRELAAQ